MNPLDAWGAGHDFENAFADLLTLLADDPDTAIAANIGDRGPGGEISPPVVNVGLRAFAASTKPVFVVANHQGTGGGEAAIAATRAGVPVLDGVPAFLVGARAMLQRRDRLAAAPDPVPDLPTDTVERARRLLDRGVTGRPWVVAPLRAGGIAVPDHRPVGSTAEAVAAAEAMGWPVVLKTAAAGVAHKSDVGGVVTGLRDGAAVRAADASMAQRLGPAALVVRMVEAPGTS